MRDKAVEGRAIVIPDQHFPFVEWPALRCVLRAVQIVKPSIFINLGDVGESKSVSHWEKSEREPCPIEFQLPPMEDDRKAINDGLDVIDAACDKANIKRRILLQGNHDVWWDKFVKRYPYMKDWTFRQVASVRERNYEYYDAGEYLRIGKLNLYHGHHYATINHTRNHLLRLGANLMYAHHHDVQQSAVTHLDGAKQAWAIGCLKDMRPEYNEFLKNKMTNWGHAFAIVDWWGDGFFTVDVVNIINGQCVVYGEKIDGNKGAQHGGGKGENRRPGVRGVARR